MRLALWSGPNEGAEREDAVKGRGNTRARGGGSALQLQVICVVAVAASQPSPHGRNLARVLKRTATRRVTRSTKRHGQLWRRNELHVYY